MMFSVVVYGRFSKELWASTCRFLGKVGQSADLFAGLKFPISPF